MTEHTRHIMNRFALLLGESRGLVALIVAHDELEIEFESRGVTKKELDELGRSIEQVSQAFYNEAIPA